MAGQGGKGIKLNGTENFNNAENASTNTTATSDLTDFLGEVTNISMPEITVGEIDVSSFDSADNFMEYVSGQKEPGTIDIELNYDPDELALALAAIGNVNEIWQISFPDDSIFKSDGFLSKALGGDTNPNGKISGTAGIKLSGVPTASTNFIAPAAPAV
jgi:hypothetical protein